MRTQQHLLLDFRTVTTLVVCCSVMLLAASVRVASAQEPTKSQPNLSGVAAAPATVSEVGGDDLYRIGPGDILDISVSKQPDYSRGGVRVDNNGMIQIPRDDRELKAACKTVVEVANEIKERYAKYLRTPYVYVEVKDFQSQPVAVIGAVNGPGRFQLQRRVRLLELLTLVNGPTDRAGGSIQIVRTRQGAMCDSQTTEATETTAGEILIAYSLKETLEAQEKANPYVRPGDIIRVVEAEQAYIVGAVLHPSPIVLKGRETLSDAIARSGGPAPGANMEKIRILRQAEGTTNKTEIVANLKAIKKHQQEDILLRPNDIIDVPGPSGAKKFLDGLIQTVVPRLAYLPLRVIP